ncbi:97_t:CDS:2, partial [Racocetra persica]
MEDQRPIILWSYPRSLSTKSRKICKVFYKAANSIYKAWDKNITEEEIVLVDADDLVRELEKILRKYCEMVNVEFKKEMLEWKEERLKIWDLKLSGKDIDYLWH